MPKFYARLVLPILIFTVSFFIQGCNVVNPPEQIPTYIHVDSFKFNPNSYFPYLSTSHSITSIWVSYNGIDIGAFDLPATFPVITKGDGTAGQLQIGAGIAMDGLNTFVAEYPFYQLDTFSFTPQPGKVIYHTPKTMYYNAIKVNPISNFDGPVLFSLVDGNIPIVTDTNSADRFMGYASGLINLAAVGDSSVNVSLDSFVVPAGAAYIEFDYKSDLQFYVGVSAYLSNIISSSPYYLAGIYPSTTWKKFYLYMSDFVGQYQADYYKLYIKTSLTSGQTSGRLLLDNVQLITF